MKHKKYPKLHNFYSRVKSLTDVQKLINSTTKIWYENKHPGISKNEIEFINNTKLSCCPFCGSIEYVKSGKNSNGYQVYQCKGCKRKFTSTTGTILDSKKIPLSE